MNQRMKDENKILQKEREELKALVMQFVSDYEDHKDDFVTYGMIGMNVKQTYIENKELIEKLKQEKIKAK